MLAAPLPPPQHFVIGTTREAIFTYAQLLPVGFCLVAAARSVHRRRDPALRVLRFPLFWTAANSAIPVVLGTVLYLIRPRITGWRNVVIIPLVPLITGGVWGAVLFPVANAQNAAHRPPMGVIDLCGAATIALSLLCVWLITQAMPRPEPTAGDITWVTPIPSETDIYSMR